MLSPYTRTPHCACSIHYTVILSPCTLHRTTHAPFPHTTHAFTLHPCTLHRRYSNTVLSTLTFTLHPCTVPLPSSHPHTQTFTLHSHTEYTIFPLHMHLHYTLTPNYTCTIHPHPQAFSIHSFSVPHMHHFPTLHMLSLCTLAPPQDATATPYSPHQHSPFTLAPYCTCTIHSSTLRAPCTIQPST